MTLVTSQAVVTWMVTQINTYVCVIYTPREHDFLFRVTRPSLSVFPSPAPLLHPQFHSLDDRCWKGWFTKLTRQCNFQYHQPSLLSEEHAANVNRCNVLSTSTQLAKAYSTMPCILPVYVYWGEREQAPHLSNGIPHDLYACLSRTSFRK